MLAVPLAVAAIAGKPDPRRFFQVDARHRVVSVTLIAGYDSSNNGFNFDGYSRGELMLTVPVGWRVRVTCTNRSALPNSCAVVHGAMNATPAFRGASSANPVQGLLQGETARFSFLASHTGVFRLTSLVAGHELARMWEVLQVVRRGTPSVVARPGP